MGKTIKLTEEQIRRFFGEGFGKRLIGEDKKINPNPNTQLASDKYNAGHVHSTGEYDKNGNPITTTQKGEDDYYYTGQHNVSREGKDLPGYGGAVAKMASFGAANLTRENAIDSNELLDTIRSIHSGPLNIIDVLRIMHQIKDKKADLSKVKNKDGEQLTNEEALSFLNGLNIDYILSNFITLNAPDYVFFRLKNLSAEEIERIYNTYGKNFENFGQRCDGCGASVWKTTVIDSEHDDAHINFEYMGSDAATNNTGRALTESSRKVVERLLPFQIHHMNENPGDNSPLNLSCLCPNCHSLTGSYGKRKRDFRPEDFKILEANTTVDDGSLMGLLDKDEQNKIANAIKKGEFGRRDISNKLMGMDLINALSPEDPDLVENVSRFGVKNPKKFIEEFNRIFAAIFDEGQELYLHANGLEKYSKSPKNGKLEESEEPQDDDEESTGDTTTKSDFTLDGLKFFYKISATKSRNIMFEMYVNEPPFIFSAFKNNNITLSPMYFENDENKQAAINDTRNEIFKSALHCVKNVRDKSNTIDDYSISGPSWTRNKDGETVMNRFRNIRPGEAAGREAASALFASKGSDKDLAMSRNVNSTGQATQRYSIPLKDLDLLYGLKEYPEEKLGGVSKKYGQGVVDAIRLAGANNLTREQFIDYLLTKGLLSKK